MYIAYRYTHSNCNQHSITGTNCDTPPSTAPEHTSLASQCFARLQTKLMQDIATCVYNVRVSFRRGRGAFTMSTDFGTILVERGL